jgi:hypothetical protein
VTSGGGSEVARKTGKGRDPGGLRRELGDSVGEGEREDPGEGLALCCWDGVWGCSVQRLIGVVSEEQRYLLEESLLRGSLK